MGESHSKTSQRYRQPYVPSEHCVGPPFPSEFYSRHRGDVGKPNIATEVCFDGNAGPTETGSNIITPAEMCVRQRNSRKNAQRLPYRFRWIPSPIDHDQMRENQHPPITDKQTAMETVGREDLDAISLLWEDHSCSLEYDGIESHQVEKEERKGPETKQRAILRSDGVFFSPLYINGSLLIREEDANRLFHRLYEMAHMSSAYITAGKPTSPSRTMAFVQQKGILRWETGQAYVTEPLLLETMFHMAKTLVKLSQRVLPLQNQDPHPKEGEKDESEWYGEEMHEQEYDRILTHPKLSGGLLASLAQRLHGQDLHPLSQQKTIRQEGNSSPSLDNIVLSPFALEQSLMASSYAIDDLAASEAFCLSLARKDPQEKELSTGSDSSHTFHTIGRGSEGSSTVCTSAMSGNVSNQRAMIPGNPIESHPEYDNDLDESDFLERKNRILKPLLLSGHDTTPARPSDRKGSQLTKGSTTNGDAIDSSVRMKKKRSRGNVREKVVTTKRKKDPYTAITHVAASIWFPKNVTVKPESLLWTDIQVYKSVIESEFDTQIQTLDSLHDINQWVRQKTKSQIHSLLKSPCDVPVSSSSSSSPSSSKTRSNCSAPKLDKVILGSAFYFRAPWVHPFDPQRTFWGTFTDKQNTQIPVQMMRYGHPQRLWCHRNRCSDMVVLPYERENANRFEAWVILPHHDSASTWTWTDVIEEVVGDPRKLYDHLRERWMDLTLPKMCLERRGCLLTALKELEPVPSQDPKNFYNIPLLHPRWKLGQVIHGAKVVLEEQSLPSTSQRQTSQRQTSQRQTSQHQTSQRQASSHYHRGNQTVIEGPTSEDVYPQSAITVTVDRPFLFMIYAVQTNDFLFQAVVETVPFEEDKQRIETLNSNQHICCKN